MKLVPGCMERWVGGVMKGFTGDAGDEWENLPHGCVGDLLSNVKMASRRNANPNPPERVFGFEAAAHGTS